MTDALSLWVAIIVGLLVILGVLWRRVVQPMARLVAKVDRFWDDWSGEPARPGVPERPGVLERLGAVEEAVTDIRHEVRPNSGASLRDAVDRVEQHVRPPE